jgi:hypothetical protein
MPRSVRLCRGSSSQTDRCTRRRLNRPFGPVARPSIVPMAVADFRSERLPACASSPKVIFENIFLSPSGPRLRRGQTSFFVFRMFHKQSLTPTRPIVIPHFAAIGGKEPRALKRWLGRHCYGLPRGRVTHRDEVCLILHGDHSPVPDWTEALIRGFHFPSSRLSILGPRKRSSSSASSSTRDLIPGTVSNRREALKSASQSGGASAGSRRRGTSKAIRVTSTKQAGMLVVEVASIGDDEAKDGRGRVFPVDPATGAESTLFVFGFGVEGRNDPIAWAVRGCAGSRARWRAGRASRDRVRGGETRRPDGV